MSRSIKNVRCDECEKEIHDNNYYVDYFGFLMCPECKENDSWMDEVSEDGK